jgi:flagellar motility protein MotE (MotC chaperone)
MAHQTTKRERKVACGLLLHRETLERLRAAAAEDLRSLNTTVEVACRAWLAEREAMAGERRRPS